MEFSFQIHYRTNWGEEVRVMLSDGQLFPLYSYDGYTWRGNLSLDPRRFSDEIVYRYAIYREGCCVRKEWDGVKRRLALNPSYGHIILADSWRDRPNDSFCYSAAFTKAKKTYQTGTEESYERAILLKVHCPRLRKADWRLAISGNQKCLGNWDLRQAKQMQACGPNEWYILLDATQINQPFEYKFLAWNTHENQLILSPPSRVSCLCFPTMRSTSPFRPGKQREWLFRSSRFAPNPAGEWAISVI